MQVEVAGGIAEEVSHIDSLIVRCAGEVDPSEDQRERNSSCQDAAPENQLVHGPSEQGALCNEGLRQQVGCDQRHDAAETPNHTALFEELPATLPVEARWRLSNPDRVVVDHAPGRKDDRESVNNECGIEVLKIA